MNKTISKILTTDRIPVMPIMTHPGIELIGKKVIDAVKDGQTHYEAVMALRKRFPQSVASTTIMDLSMEAEAFGANIVFDDNEVPTVSGRMLESAADVEALQIPSLDTKRVPEYLKANRLATAELDVPLFGGCIGPFSLAGRLYDMTELMMAMYIEPDTANLLLDKCTQFILEYCKQIKASGSAGVVMAEPAAGLLSNDDCQAYSSRFVKTIVDAVQDDNFVVMLHNCGNTGQCTKAMIETGAAALHFGNAIDMAQVLEEVPADIAVSGNINPVEIMKFGTPQQVEDVAKQLIKLADKHNNFILSTGCDVPPETPFENIESLFNATI
ncbi:MAG: uroporphyrinogen decarboxylase family protein [Bacteroidaceae bacterium]|nr:uroporphyrinogen decarboxylase family protein [Bacteroidaceae bacterium]